MKASTLQKKLKAITEMPEAQRIRLHRAISWLSCAEAQSEDLDIQFITQWIAFNACYAMDQHERDQKPEREKFRQFIANLVKYDHEKRIFNILWHRFSGPVRNLIDNQYVFKGFWDFQRKEAKEWKTSFEKANKLAYGYLSENNVVGLLEILLDRLYVLRNQLVHGGATYRSNVNRTQVDHGCQILFLLIPVIIELIMEHPDEEWGDISYPVIK